MVTMLQRNLPTCFCLWTQNEYDALLSVIKLNFKAQARRSY